jgi:hypothetical protein
VAGTTAQTFIPNDSATIIGTGTLGGTVTFKLYTLLSDCQAENNNPVYTETVNVSGSSPQTVSTNNDGDPVDANATPPDTIAGYTVNAGNAGTLFWRVTYTPGANSSHTGSSSVCVEDSSVTIDNTTPPPA